MAGRKSRAAVNRLSFPVFWQPLRKFARGYLIPRSRSRLIVYVGKYSPSELRELNELTTVDRRLTEAEGKRFSRVTNDLIKIEDAVLGEIPKSKFPNFD